MHTLVILPEELIRAPELERCLRLCRSRFGKYGEIRVAAPPDMLAGFRSLLPLEGDIRVLTDEERLWADILVFVYVSSPPSSIVKRNGSRVYFYAAYPYIRGGMGPFESIEPNHYDVFEHPLIESHIFNRLSSKTWGFVNFPYGVLYMDALSGPIDAFGFRINFDSRILINRTPTHKVVAIFGGSAAFSCSCSYEEMFASRLEEFLNVQAQKQDANTRWTVVNFGMHDNVVMQEMLTYLLFVDRLKPDVVISHNGHNDIWYGLSCDPYLVAGHQLIYQRHSEEWSRILHKTTDIPASDINTYSSEGQEMNLPQNIIAAFMTRKRQFHSLVERHGGKFLWSMQPLITSRIEKSEVEQHIMSAIERTVCLRTVKFYKAVFSTYEMLVQEHIRHFGSKFINLHHHFQTFDSTHHLMNDHVHCTPAGDEVIAKVYANAILSEYSKENYS
jgi:hypothetical protein